MSDRIHVLLVDDEEEFLDATAKVLERRGFVVTCATRGEQALAIARSCRVDVLVLDVKMPGIDGEETYRRLHREHPGLPVLMLTGHGSVPQAFQMSKDGVFDYLAKPCEPDELARRIRQAAASASRRPRAAQRPVDLLLVDDDPELLEALAPALERREMTVRTAASADQAVAQLDRRPAEVVVVDLRLPGLSGLELVHLLRSRPEAPEVVVLTGHPDVATAVAAMQAGAADYLVKPPDLERLVELIRTAADLRESRVSLRREAAVRRAVEQIPD